MFAQPSIHPSLSLFLSRFPLTWTLLKSKPLCPFEGFFFSLWMINGLNALAGGEPNQTFQQDLHSHTEIRGTVTHQTSCTILTLMCLPVWASARISALQTGEFTPLSGSDNMIFSNSFYSQIYTKQTRLYVMLNIHILNLKWLLSCVALNSLKYCKIVISWEFKVFFSVYSSLITWNICIIQINT